MSVEILRVGYLSRLRGIARDVQLVLNKVSRDDFGLDARLKIPPMDNRRGMMIYYSDLVQNIRQAPDLSRFLVLCPFPPDQHLASDAPLVEALGKATQAEVVARFREDTFGQPGQTMSGDMPMRVPMLAIIPDSTELAAPIQELNALSIKNIGVIHAANLTGNTADLPDQLCLDHDTVKEILSSLIEGKYANHEAFGFADVA